MVVITVYTEKLAGSGPYSRSKGLIRKYAVDDEQKSHNGIARARARVLPIIAENAKFALD